MDARFQKLHTGSYVIKSILCRGKEALFDALNCPDGHDNPFVQLRLRETLFELGDMEGAKEHLLRSYMLEGIDIFEEENSKYVAFMEKTFNLK